MLLAARRKEGCDVARTVLFAKKEIPSRPGAGRDPYRGICR